MELMGCLHQPQGLQSDQQTMQVVYHAKQSMYTSHKAALSMLSLSTLNSPLSLQMSSVLIEYHRDIWLFQDMICMSIMALAIVATFIHGLTQYLQIYQSLNYHNLLKLGLFHVIHL